MLKTSKYSLRPAAAFAIVLMMLLIPTIRLAVIIGRDGYHQAAATQSIYTVNIGSARGTIYDRNMLRFTNDDVFYVGTAAYYAYPAALTAALKETANDPDAAIQAAQSGKPFMFSAVKENYGDGVLSFPVYRRYSGSSAHLIGYPTTATERGYTGLEAAFSSVLDKYSGSISVSYTVNATGRSLSGFEPDVTNTMSNADGGVVLTLDRRLQDFAQEQLKDVCGAIVVMSADGDILAAVSSPTFDPEDIAESLDDPNSPLINRVLSAYDVGSVFKTVVTTAALEAGISTDRTYVCHGQIDVGGVIIRCNNRSGHGEMDMKTALVRSCNPYFIDLAQEIGAGRLIETAKAMGFGESIVLADGIVSKAGNLPNAEALSPPAALANLAIGQGSLLATPLQIAAAINCVTTGGVYVAPRLVIGEVNNTGKLVSSAVRPYNRRVMSENSAQTLLENMAAVFSDGNISQYQPEAYTAAGKTSTAQTGITAEDGHSVYQAWLAGVFPAVSPQYTVTVMVEDGDAGSSSCGPIFKAVCDYITDTLM